jgi:5-methylcytosine-specific restriction endonuclease McrA
MPKCKQCRNPASQRFGLHTFCDTDCAYQFAIAAKEKSAVKKQKEFNAETRRRKVALKSRGGWLKDLQVVFNRFIRLRDAGKPCVSCGRPDGDDHQRHASHYKSRGAHPELAFNVFNCHASCATCNNFLSGNLVPYRIELINRIGLGKVEWLEGKHEPLKLTIEEIKVLISEYRVKIKALSGDKK